MNGGRNDIYGISVAKDLAIIIRYFSEKLRKVTDCLLEIFSLSSATGELIFNAIKKTLDWYCLDLNKCVGFGCNGDSVMVGQHFSVWSRIKEVNINPSCILMKCIHHSLVLWAGSAWFQEAVEQLGIPVLGRIQHLTKEVRINARRRH